MMTFISVLMFFLIQSENSEIDHQDFGVSVSGTWVRQLSKPEWSGEGSNMVAKHVWQLPYGSC